MAESIFETNPADLIKERRGPYLMVNAIAKRVRGLQLGEKALALSPDGTRDAVKIATQEFLDDKLEIIRRQPSEEPDFADEEQVEEEEGEDL